MPQSFFDKTLITERPEEDSQRWKKHHACLVVMQGAEIGRDFRLRRGSMTIGRGLDVDIRIPDDLASRRHARVDFNWDPFRETASFVLVDLDSTNHTFVNSRQVDRTDLQDGDKIQIGDTVLKFVVLDEIEVKFHAEVRNRITFDQLTGLLTKESLYLALEMELKRCHRYTVPLAVLMMDIDHFKAVNDTRGHLMGSHVLAEVGRLISRSIRGADVAARYGGEEFIAYLPEADGAGAVQVAERIRMNIESNEFTLDGQTARTTISVGIGLFPAHGGELKALVARADRALYRAKEDGRNRVCLDVN
ncbi:MAG TPA: GGDEF domain-containing protein [Candidatus Polarisedimenticolia bacterium]|nr:GGDEF domain-containing protein [Candidatus Polarisedimenticolia bacterium]